MSLAADRVSLQAGRRLIVDRVSIEVAPGEVHALLGPNGAGKTSLLRLLAGDIAPAGGELSFDRRPLMDYNKAALARRRAVLAQGDSLRFALLVGEIVALGRIAIAKTRGQTERIVELALAASGISRLRDRSYLSLSGGERARVRLARALAQVWEQFESPAAETPRYLLLDEPAAHLDPAHQQLCLKTVRRFADHGGGALLSLHDPNLALTYADRVSLIREGRLIASGNPARVLTPEHLQQVYGTAVERIERQGKAPVIVFV